MKTIKEMPYFLEAIGQPVHICNHMIKPEKRTEIHFISLRGKMRFAFCVNCFATLMKHAGCPDNKIQKYIKKIGTTIE